MAEAFLPEFASALSGASGAIEIQRAVRHHDSTRRLDAVQLRYGVRVRNLISARGSIGGDTVNDPSRVELMEEPARICVGQPVYGHLGDNVRVTTEELAKCQLTNVSAPVGF